MDIVAINEAIQSLENDDTTVDNVSELSALYICRDHLYRTQSFDATETELRDIFPYYKKYREVKYRYQLNQTTEGEVIENMNAVCKELKEFVDTLYSGTDMNKERMCIRQLLKELNEKYNNTQEEAVWKN